MKLGGAAVGLLVGTALGAVTATLLQVLGTREFALPGFFATVLVGTAAGFAFPGLMLGSLEALAHLLFGLFNGLSLQDPQASPLAPLWLKAILSFGVALGIVAFILLA